MMQLKIFLLSLVLVSAIPATSYAQAPSCQSFFSDTYTVRGLRLTNFQETMALLYLTVGEKMTPPILEQMEIFEKLSRVNHKIDLLRPLNIERYKSKDGKTKLHWKDVNLSDPKEASKALVKVSRLLALEHFNSLQGNKSLFQKLKNLKSSTLERIEMEVYLKALLQAEDHFQKSSDLSIFLPWNFLRTENVKIDKKMIDTLNNDGLEAFHEALVSRYGWRVSNKIVSDTSKNLTKLAGAISVAIIIYFYQKGDDYFSKVLSLETGLEGEDFNMFSHILKVSGLKSTKDVLNWLGSQKSEDPDINLFMKELQLELKK